MADTQQKLTIKETGVGLHYGRETVQIKDSEGNRTEHSVGDEISVTEDQAKSLRDAGVVFEGDESSSTEDESNETSEEPTSPLFSQ